MPGGAWSKKRCPCERRIVASKFGAPCGEYLRHSGYCVRDADPSFGLINRAAKGRSATWSEGEAVRLFKRAWRDGYHRLGAVIAVAWSTQLSPGDVRFLRACQLVRDDAGAVFFTHRARPTRR
jgi:hypothetical protein